MADVLLNDAGDMPKHPEIASGFRATVQQVGARLGIFQGRWQADDTVGFPWLEWFRTLPPPIQEMVSVIPLEIEQIDGVQEVEAFSGSFDSDTGIITFEGTILGQQQGEEAVVEVTFDRTEPNTRSSFAIKSLAA